MLKFKGKFVKQYVSKSSVQAMHGTFYTSVMLLTCVSLSSDRMIRLVSKYHKQYVLAWKSIFAHVSTWYFFYFLGQNDRATPNLGTSTSLNSKPSGSNQSFKYLLSPRDSKQKRPFLRRLMSCLVMHSAKASQANVPCESKDSDVNSSVDSYYISTSLGVSVVISNSL